MKDVPYFPLYAANIIASKYYRLMNLQERGLWISILMECWPNISVPNDVEELTAYLGARDGEITQQSLDKVLKVFQTRNDQIFSQELDDQRRNYLERRLKQSAGGIKGVESKKAKNALVAELAGTPKGQPEGSLDQVNSTQINSTQINSNYPNKELLPYEDGFVDKNDEAIPF
ncbi:hypothetical protein [Polynucleobacter sp.]|uniref:hypothetical protein n=1 Tax=Polynucleobacter sp. TaxID=2029855 RepID=UPI003F6A1B5F